MSLIAALDTFDTAQVENKGPALLWVLSVGIIIAFVVVLLRLWVRLGIIRKTGPDDWAVLASLVSLSRL